MLLGAVLSQFSLLGSFWSKSASDLQSTMWSSEQSPKQTQHAFAELQDGPGAISSEDFALWQHEYSSLPNRQLISTLLR